MAKKSVSNKKRASAIIAVVLAAGLFGVSGWLWWTRIFTDSQHVFDDMLANSLSSTSVSRKVVQKDQSSSVDQTTFVTFRPPEVTSQTVTLIGEKGLNRKTTTVKTETIGTQNRDLVQYVSAEGAEDLSIAGNLGNVLGVWGERTADPENGQGTAFLNEAIFSIVPFGNLTSQQRGELLKLVDEKNVYALTRGEKSFVDGRYVYVYNVSINPVGLVEMLAKYVELTGVGDNSQLDPALYVNSPALNVTMTVDIPSRQLLSLDYLATGRSETIESRNLFRDIKLPPQTIPFDELQNRLTGASSAQPQQQTQTEDF